MQNKLFEITLRYYIPYTQTGNIDLLKRYGVNASNIEELNSLVDERLGGNQDEFLQKESDKLSSKYKILNLETLNNALLKIMSYEAQIIELGKVIGKILKDKKSEYYIKKVYDLTQIRIEKIDDVQKISKEIERLQDKYIESFKESDSETSEKGVTFTQIVFKVFQLNGFDKVDYDTTLGSFFELKDSIPKKVEDGR